MDKKLEDLKPGTKVLIRKDLEVEKAYGNNRFEYEMLVNAGKVVTIKSDYDEYGYDIEECDFCYTPEMIECVVQPNKELFLVQLNNGTTEWWLQDDIEAFVGDYILAENKNDLELGQVIGTATVSTSVEFGHKKTVGKLTK